MSTSPKRSPETTGPGSEGPQRNIQPFPYARFPASSGAGDSGEGGFSYLPGTAGVQDTSAPEGQIRALGHQEGLAEARQKFDEQLEQQRAGLAAALGQFARDRSVYFQKVEAEVVQLALSIARKILHREAQLDPLLLAAIVRVALEKIDGATQVVLRLPPQHVVEWQKYLMSHMESADLPDFVEDPSQEPNSCVLQTAMGTTVVGTEVQLKEIEQGLMDLLAARPDGLP